MADVDPKALTRLVIFGIAGLAFVFGAALLWNAHDTGLFADLAS